MLQAIIVDDEPRSRDTLRNFLNEFCPQQVNVVALADSVDTGAEAVLQHPDVDLLFLDIEMNRETGFDLLRRFREIPFEVIFTTAHEGYALKAIKTCAIDYLLKPIDIEELKSAVGKVQDKRSKASFHQRFEAFMHNMQHPARKEKQQIAVATTEGLLFLNIVDILRCEADGAYTGFHLKNGSKVFVSKNLKEYEGLLAEYGFFRVHHSFIINMNEIKKYVRGEGGYVIMSDDFMVDVSKRKKDAFLAQIAKL
jgi:two-component system LytT family response regulator